MNIFLSDHMTVEKVTPDGVAIVTLRIPVGMLDDITALAEYAIHASRLMSRKARSCGNSATYPSRFMRVNK